MKPNLFEYEDYRKYLRDSYEESKASKRSFSFRFFAREAGFASPNFLKLVMDGARNLTIDSIPKFSKALKLTRPEAEFFEALVLFNQAHTAEEKSRHYGRMAKSRRFREVKSLAREQFEYYSKWYYSAVRELVELPDFSADPFEICRRLVPNIAPKQAKDALALLKKLNLVEAGPDGKLRQVDRTITSGAEVKSLHVINFHREMLARAAESMDLVPAPERDISAVTLGVPASKVAEVKERIARFRRDLLASIGAAEEKPDRVYQLNLQFFPLSRKPKEKK